MSDINPKEVIAILQKRLNSMRAEYPIKVKEGRMKEYDANRSIEIQEYLIKTVRESTLQPQLFKS